MNKVVITSNFEARGWQPAETEEGWDIWWASTSSVQQLFSPGSLTKLRPGQLVNHFPNHFELTHKDLLVKNVNRYRRRMRKAGHSIPHITPATFVLPQVMVMQLLCGQHNLGHAQSSQHSLVPPYDVALCCWLT